MSGAVVYQDYSWWCDDCCEHYGGFDDEIQAQDDADEHNGEFHAAVDSEDDAS